MKYNTVLFISFLLIINSALLLKLNSESKSSSELNLELSSNNKSSSIAKVSIKLKKVKNPKILSFLEKTQSSLKEKKVLLQSNSFLKLSTSTVATSGTSAASNSTISSTTVSPITLKNYKNSQYIGTIQIGNPPQNIPVIFDTGSGNLMVNSSRCDSKACKSHISYNHKKSSDFKSVGLGVEVTFGTGQVVSEINTDTITIGGLKVENQSFGEIIKEKGDVFDDGFFSGILGLGFNSLSAYGTPLLDTMLNAKSLDKNIMTFYYSYDEGTDGEVTFGFIDNSKYSGELTYFKVIDPYYWTIALKDILYDGKSLGLCKDSCKVAIDTGTSLMTGPSSDLDTLLSNIPITDDCTNLSSIKNISFIFDDDKEYSLSPQEYVHSNDEKTECRSLLIPMDVDKPHGPIWVIGDIFMQKYFTVFDRDTNSVGFALANHNEKRNNYE